MFRIRPSSLARTRPRLAAACQSWSFLVTPYRTDSGAPSSSVARAVESATGSNGGASMMTKSLLPRRFSTQLRHLARRQQLARVRRRQAGAHDEQPGLEIGLQDLLTAGGPARTFVSPTPPTIPRYLVSRGRRRSGSSTLTSLIRVGQRQTQVRSPPSSVLGRNGARHHDHFVGLIDVEELQARPQLPVVLRRPVAGLGEDVPVGQHVVADDRPMTGEPASDIAA
jgi:hypothetical protein